MLNTFAIKTAEWDNINHANDLYCVLCNAKQIKAADLPVLANKLLLDNELNVFQQRKSLMAKKEYIASRFLIKTLISQQLRLPYKKIQLRFNNTSLKLQALFNHQALDINISLAHSKGMIFFAISDEKNILGVDIEVQNINRDILSVAEAFYHPEECKTLTKNSVQQFYQLWTLKESLAKATGQSIFQLLGQNTQQLLNNYQHTLGQFEQFQLAAIHSNASSTIPCYVLSLNNLIALCHE